jgi:hypothetical protein
MLKLPRWDPATEPPPAQEQAPEALAPATAEVTPADRAHFLSLSVELTGFGEVELLGTGVTDVYLAYLLRVFPKVTPNLLGSWQKIEKLPPAERAEALRKLILGDPCLGPFAKGVIKLWYTGNWEAMKQDWSRACGESDHEEESSLLAIAYTQGLMWQAAIGAHPQAAKATGFASWSEAPEED